MWGAVRVTNQALGAATDLLVQNGGTAILSETPEIYGAEHLLTRRAVSREVVDKLISTRVKADSFQGFQNGASSESCPSASATGPMHDAQCGLVFRGARNPALRLSWAVSPYHFRQSVSGPTSRQVA